MFSDDSDIKPEVNKMFKQTKLTIHFKKTNSLENTHKKNIDSHITSKKIESHVFKTFHKENSRFMWLQWLISSKKKYQFYAYFYKN